MKSNENVFACVLVALREVKGAAIPAHVDGSESLVLHLGFDSMNMALLSLTLEKGLGRAVALDGWIESRRDPRALTVSSLVDYLADIFNDDESLALSA